MSEHYRALTRTYRPTSFEDIVSQDHVSDTLKNAIKQQRLAHSYMFCGPRGVGKTTMARVLARTVNEIDASVDGEGLNQTLNIVEIDAASNNSVDDIRDLRERVRIPPQNGRYKIYIIDEVHMLSKQAFNALLKTLEEPPDHVIFIFATTEPHKVLPTILSRVQRFDFKRIRVAEIVDRLKKVAENEQIKIDLESLHVIAKKADGSLRDALGLLDQAIAFCGNDIHYNELLKALNVVSTDRMFQFMETVEKRDAGSGLDLINELLQEGYDIQEFLIELTEHLRNLYIAKNTDHLYLVEASEETKNRYRLTSEAFSQDDLMRMMHLVSEAQFKIREAHQPRIQFEITLLKLVHLERSRNIHHLLNELEDLKKKLADIPGQSEKLNGEEVTTEDYPVKNANGAAGNHNGAESAETGHGTELGTDTAHESAPTVDEPAFAIDDDEADFFGRPSLGRPNSTASNHTNGTNGKIDTDIAEDARAAAPAGTQKITLDTVTDSWEEYLDLLSEGVPQTLYFQMQRINPIGCRNRDLILRCDNDFAKRIVDENRRELARFLESVTGVFFRFKSVVQKNEGEPDETVSPYERFKQLQERDPAIKKLVELFGAELDYNLNG